MKIRVCVCGHELTEDDGMLQCSTPSGTEAEPPTTSDSPHKTDAAGWQPSFDDIDATFMRDLF